MIQTLWHIKESEGSAEMNMSELHLFFILRNRPYIHMHEALDAKYNEESKQRHLLKAQWHSLQFFPDFSNKAFLLQLLNTAAGSKRQGLYCDHPANSDALGFCPNWQKTALFTSVAPSHGRAGSSCDAGAVAAVVCKRKNKSLSGHQNSAELAQGESQSSGSPKNNEPSLSGHFPASHFYAVCGPLAHSGHVFF